MNHRKIISGLLALTVVLTLCTVARAGQAAYPNKPIHVLSHSAPGSNDFFIRALQPYLQRELGVPVVIENVLGAAGRLCTTQVYNADPDGYTILSNTIPLTIVGQILYKGKYDTLKFEHIFSFDDSPYCVIVKKGSPYATFTDLIAAIKKNPETTNGTSGVGGAMHLQSMVMKTTLGLDYAGIPFDGSGNAMLAVMAGDVDFCIIQFDLPLNNLEEVEVLAMFNDKRLEQYPDTPPPRSWASSSRPSTATVVSTLLPAPRRKSSIPLSRLSAAPWPIRSSRTGSNPAEFFSTRNTVRNTTKSPRKPMTWFTVSKISSKSTDSGCVSSVRPDFRKSL